MIPLPNKTICYIKMKVLPSFIFLLICFCLGFADDEVVTSLDVDSFDAFLETHSDVVVKFYAPVRVEIII